MLLSFEFDGGLPGYDLIEEILLFNAAFVKIDAGGLDTFVTQNIGEKCNIIALFHKIFCEQMAEGMRVNNGWIKMIAQSENFQLITDPVSTDRTAKAVQEQTAFGFAATSDRSPVHCGGNKYAGSCCLLNKGRADHAGYPLSGSEQVH